MSYAWQQLRSAVRTLTASSERRERLIGAFGKLTKLKSKDLPAEVVADFSRLVGDIPRYPAKSINREIKEAVELLTDEEVAEAIDIIFAMHDALSVYQPNPVRYPSRARRPTETIHAWPITGIPAGRARKGDFEPVRVM